MDSASVVTSSPSYQDKSCHHDEPLQLHSMPSWKRYESEEEEVSETSSLRAFTPSEAESESVVVENGLPSPSREDSDGSCSLSSRPLSIVTAKRNSAATYTLHEDEYVTPPASPISIFRASTGETDASSMTEEDGVVEEDDDDEEEVVEQVFEAKKVLYTAPASRPNIIFIQSLPSDSSPSLHPDNQETPNLEPGENNKHPENLRKRSSTASGLSPPDRPKRYSAMFMRDDGELAYADSRSHVRARSAQRVGGNSPYRSRAASPSVNGNNPRPQLLRRNTSQRSTRSVYIAAPDEPVRPRTFRSSSIASDNTSSSSRSSKQPFTQNSSTSSFHSYSSSSIEPPLPDLDKSKPTPHPLSIITTLSPPPVQFSGPFGNSPRTSSPTPHVRSESLPCDVDPISPAPSSACSPLEPPDYSEGSSQMSMAKARGIYSLRHNPHLSLSTRPEDLEPADQRQQSGQQSSKEWAFVSSPVSAKASKAGASAMKSLMGGFRGLGRPRKRSLAPAPN